jgi:hypothetical protein
MQLDLIKTCLLCRKGHMISVLKEILLQKDGEVIYYLLLLKCIIKSSIIITDKESFQDE